MADENENVNENVKTREQKLSEVHSEDKVYAKADGENKHITFDAYKDVVGGGKVKVPVTTSYNNRLETHFTFDKPSDNE